MGDYAYFLAAALADIGCSVEVLTSIGGSESTLYPSHPEVEVHRVVEDWGVTGFPDVIGVVKNLKAEVLFLQYTPHAYQRQGITLGPNLLPAVVRATTSKKVAVNFHELFIPFDSSIKHAIGAAWQRAMAFLIAMTGNSVTAISSEWPRRLRGVGVRRDITVIPVGSNIPRAVSSPTEVSAIRVRLLRAEEGVVVGCFGATRTSRDFGLLRDALRKARSSLRLRAVWLGKAEATSPLAGDDDIVWTGPLPHPELSRMMSACDLFVLPFTDGVSTKRGTLAAALMHGLPVVSTKGSSVDDIFVHGDNIYLVTKGNAEELARALVEVGSSPRLRARLAAGAQSLYARHFAWGEIARRILEAAITRSAKP